MELPDFTVEHLKALPLRAIVAFAARCARRVEPLAQLPEGHPQRQDRRVAVEAALAMAEAFARGADRPPDESVVDAIDAIRDVAGGPARSTDAAAAAAWAAHAAVSGWHTLRVQEAEDYRPLLGGTAGDRSHIGVIEHLTVDLAALDAFTAAVEAYGAVGCDNEAFVAAALNDYDRLLHMNLGHYPEPGELIDPSPSGPLGRL